MKLTKNATSIVILLLATSSFAQEAQNPPQQPKTKLEQFQAKTGSVIVRGFSIIGGVPGQFESFMTVESKEFTDASTGAKQYGITIKVTENSPHRENTSYIDLDEIDSLLKGITYIGAITKSVTKLKDFQADYRTKGDFGISTFSNTPTGEIGVAVRSGTYGHTTAYFDLKDLPKMSQLIQAAQTTLQTIKEP
jgi:hypothetical protein